MGGSLAQADPASELPACVLALGDRRSREQQSAKGEDFQCRTRV
ncbi:hypothetical protein ACQR1W_33920 [Bradyrhizobium sp. HKCCYLS1011]